MWRRSSGSRRSNKGVGSLMRSACMIVSIPSEPLARANIARPIGSPASDEIFCVSDEVALSASAGGIAYYNTCEFTEE